MPMTARLYNKSHLRHTINNNSRGIAGYDIRNCYETDRLKTYGSYGLRMCATFKIAWESGNLENPGHPGVNPERRC